MVVHSHQLAPQAALTYVKAQTHEAERVAEHIRRVEARRVACAADAEAALADSEGQGQGRLTVGVVNTVWNAVCRVAQVQGRTPHSARHAMGKHIIAKTGNITAVQQQLGHRQAAYAMQYARATTEEVGRVLDDR